MDISGTSCALAWRVRAWDGWHSPLVHRVLLFYSLCQAFFFFFFFFFFSARRLSSQEIYAPSLRESM